jgi:hypothetical protein
MVELQLTFQNDPASLRPEISKAACHVPPRIASLVINPTAANALPVVED